MASLDNSAELSFQERIMFSIIFLLGIIFSYVSFMPIGIILASVLIFQRKSRQFFALGLVLFILQLVALFIFLGDKLDAQMVYPV
jgi:uncharacterized membrane protein